MADVIIVILLIALIVGVIYRIRKNKKSGDTCVGCPIQDCSRKNIEAQDQKRLGETKD